MVVGRCDGNDGRNDMQVAILLLDQSDNVFGRTSRRLDGLTDAELLWEPAPHCSVTAGPRSRRG
jgi:hypothetical protein